MDHRIHIPTPHHHLILGTATVKILLHGLHIPTLNRPLALMKMRYFLLHISIPTIPTLPHPLQYYHR